MSSAAADSLTLQDDPFLRKLRSARKMLDEAELALRRAEAAARPIHYLDLHPARRAPVEAPASLRMAN